MVKSAIGVIVGVCHPFQLVIQVWVAAVELSSTFMF